ncbi:SLATT domain-containing protein [Paenibacillus apis]|uniref:DUF4231 domain-containing protein n=1 Tax=Paenibacillus apis TaxID=1792174 RepID=A0A920CJU5_9BACL|nr:DUF4231 domain-containing protein [Paenibacillus apis]GIO43166.1 hypothetical protein J41TS4_29240 [Paenibacillus apis]
MNSNTMLNELKNQLGYELQECRKELDAVRKRSKILNIASIILSSVVTVLAGLKTLTLPVMGDIILFISAAVTILGGIRTFFNYEKQIQYLTKTFFDLALLDREIDLYTYALDGENSDGQVVTNFANRFLGIVYDHAQKVISFKDNEDKALNIPEK